MRGAAMQWQVIQPAPDIGKSLEIAFDESVP